MQASPSDRAALLVLGGSGFLGRALLRAALGPAAAAHGVAIGSGAESGVGTLVATSRGAVAPAAGGPGGARLAWETLSLQDEDALERCFRLHRPRACILTAALSRMGACESDPTAAERVNARAPERVARLALRHGTRLVHVSTDLVFGGTPPRAEGYREADRPAPRSVYGATKAAGEERVLSIYPDALVVRLPLLFGRSGGLGAGASDQLLAALVAGERPGLFADEWRTPLDVGDAARALLELARDHRGVAGRLHVAGPERLDRHALGLTVLTAKGWSATDARAALERTTRGAKGLAEQRPADVSLDAAVARRLLSTRLRAPGEALQGPDGPRALPPDGLA